MSILISKKRNIEECQIGELVSGEERLELKKKIFALPEKEQVFAKQATLLRGIQAKDLDFVKFVVENLKASVNAILSKDLKPLEVALEIEAEAGLGEFPVTDYLLMQGATDKSKEDLAKEEVLNDLKRLFKATDKDLQQTITMNILTVFQEYPSWVEWEFLIRIGQKGEGGGAFNILKTTNLTVMGLLEHFKLTSFINPKALLEERVLSIKSEEEMVDFLDRCPNALDFKVNNGSLIHYLGDKYPRLISFLRKKVEEKLDHLTENFVVDVSPIFLFLKACPEALDIPLSSGRTIDHWAEEKKLTSLKIAISSILNSQKIVLLEEKPPNEQKIIEFFKKHPICIKDPIQLFSNQTRLVLSLIEYVKSIGLTKVAEYVEAKEDEEFKTLVLEEDPSEETIIAFLKGNPKRGGFFVESSSGNPISFFDLARSRSWLKVLDILIDFEKTELLTATPPDEEKIIAFLRKHSECIKEAIKIVSDGNSFSFFSLQEYAEAKGFTAVVKYIIQVEDEEFKALILEEYPSEERIIDFLKSNLERGNFEVSEEGENRSFFDLAISRRWNLVISFLINTPNCLEPDKKGFSLFFQIFEASPWFELDQLETQKQIALLHQVVSDGRFFGVNNAFINRNGVYYTPLLYYIAEGNFGLVTKLVEYFGADVNRSLFHGKKIVSPLSLAISQARNYLGDSKKRRCEILEIVSYLESKGALLEGKGRIEEFEKE